MPRTTSAAIGSHVLVCGPARANGTVDDEEAGQGDGVGAERVGIAAGHRAADQRSDALGANSRPAVSARRRGPAASRMAAAASRRTGRAGQKQQRGRRRDRRCRSSRTSTRAPAPEGSDQAAKPTVSALPASTGRTTSGRPEPPPRLTLDSPYSRPTTPGDSRSSPGTSRRAPAGCLRAGRSRVQVYGPTPWAEVRRDGDGE